MYSEITLVGRVGRDPELRFTPQNGTAVCNFSLAVNRNRRVGNDWQEETTWFKITFWGEQAERVNQRITKGMLLLVVGDRIEADHYTNNEGRVIVNLNVTARTYRTLVRGGDSQGGGGGNYDNNYDDGDNYGGAPNSPEDIPF